MIGNVEHLRSALESFEAFKETVLDASSPDDMHPGLYKAEAIRTHHIATNEILKPDAFDTPLGSISSKDTGVADDVADAMVYYPWTEVYGLSYLETWQLPYSTWVYLYNTIRKMYPKGRRSFNKETAQPTTDDPKEKKGRRT